MERVKDIGEDAYNAEQKEKVEIFPFLLSGFNNGRRKTFFCAAVNLLDLSELRETIRLLTEDPVSGRLPLKEKSARAVQLLQQAAEQGESR